MSKKHTNTNPTALSHEAQTRLKEFFERGRKLGCPDDQLLNFSGAVIILQPRQLAASAAARLCDLPDGPRAVGYGGARGGGKSHWLLAQMGADDCQRIPGLKCLLLRKVGKSNLEHFEGLRQSVFARLPHEFSASRGLLTFANGSHIVLGHYQCEKDIDSYLGLEYDIIGIEEATQLTARKYEDISTCCRTSKPGWRPRIYSTTNPGGVGHQWYFDKFIAPHQSGIEKDTRFIPARVEDNLFLNADYKEHMASRTGWQYAAWYQGRWDFAAGQYFRNFNPGIHVLRENFQLPYRPKWFAALDYGYTHLTVALLACQDDKGVIYVMDEHAERGWIPGRHAVAIKAMLSRHCIFSTEDHLKEYLHARYPGGYCTEREALWYRYRQQNMLSRFVAGTDVFGRESNGLTVAREYMNHGLTFWPADTDRVSGWSAIAQRLGDPDAGIAPTIFFHPRCRRLITCLPYLQHDPEKPGDVLKTDINEEGAGGDDAGDALRYLVATQPRTIHQARLRGL